MPIDMDTLQLIAVVLICGLALLVVGGLALSAKSYTQLLELIKFLASWVIDLETTRRNGVSSEEKPAVHTAYIPYKEIPPDTETKVPYKIRANVEKSPTPKE